MTTSLFAKVGAAYRFLISGSSYLQPVVLLAIRLSWGWQFFEAGYGKLKDLESTTNYFATDLHIPFPALNAALAGSAECFGGILLMAGLASRLTSIPLIFTMLVAFATAEKDALGVFFSDPDKVLEATPFPFLIASVVILAFGPGLLSLDCVIKKFVTKQWPPVHSATGENKPV